MDTAKSMNDNRRSKDPGLFRVMPNKEQEIMATAAINVPNGKPPGRFTRRTDSIPKINGMRQKMARVVNMETILTGSFVSVIVVATPFYGRRGIME
jgi:hypothetical protein